MTLRGRSAVRPRASRDGEPGRRCFVVAPPPAPGSRTIGRTPECGSGGPVSVFFPQPGGFEGQLSACEPVPEPPQDAGVHSWSERLHAAPAPGEVVVGAGIVAPGV